VVKSQYEDLTQITNVLLERQLDIYRRNLAESARLAAELAQIDGLREAAQADVGGIGARQILGADALWQGWLVRKRAEVLRRMAMARAQQADSQARARIAFSRAEATKTLALEEAVFQKERRQRMESEAIETLSILLEDAKNNFI
jgi:hypothetical protein